MRRPGWRSAHATGSRGGPIDARRVPRRASKRGAVGGATRVAVSSAASATSGLAVGSMPAAAAAELGESPSRTPSTARSSRSAADGWGLITLLLTPRSPIRYTVGAAPPESVPSTARTVSRRDPGRAGPRAHATRDAGGREPPPRCDPGRRRSREPSARRRSAGSRPGADPPRADATAARRRRASSAVPARPAGSSDRGRLGHRVERRRSMAAPRPQRVRELVVGDPEEPRPERRSLVAIAVDGAQRGQEGALRGVLRVVMVAEQVEAVAVDRIQVTPIQVANAA